MNNEEKILSMLAEIQAEQLSMREQQRRTNERLDKMDERMVVLEEGQKQTNERLTNIEKRLKPLEEETVKTRLEIENRIIPGIQKVAEGHTQIIETMATKEQIDQFREEWEVERVALTIIAKHGSV